jgi:23S rRNA (cytidine2498-2'-O)-methyltransferase
MEQTGYLAAEGFERELEAELGAVSARHGRLLLAPGPPRPAAWAQNVWHAPHPIPIASIKDGARQLRALQRNWALYDYRLHRRAKLLQDQLPHVASKPIRFGGEVPKAPLGSWTLIEADTILASPACASPFRHGAVEFVEDKAGPPSRAYLKLWEAFTLLGVRPEPDALCLDLGASPGGWTWALQSLGCRVLAIDKAGLEPKIAALSGVETRRMSAFALAPEEIGAEFGPIDWLFSDLVCYPARLLTLVGKWLGSGLVRRFVCTLKFQGETDHATARAFAAIPGSRLMHLSHNKHELTWVKTE